MTDQNPAKRFATTDMSTGFIRAVTEKTGRIRAEGTLFDPAGRPVAHGTETCTILETGPAK